MATPILGEIRMFAGNFAPRGYALCNGQIMSIAQNTALFSLLGTTYGGDGRTTFALPNLQSRVPIHMGTGPGLSTYVEGQQGGTEAVTLNTNQMPIHSHLVNSVGNGGNQASPVNSMPAVESTGTSLNYSNAAVTGQMNPGTIGNSGGSQPFPIVQPYLVINFIIALQGIFPSRN
ncbi:MAG TPA: tail fiber protein [Verrucomicrobiae bacterium]|jgi:microcystin-dependent protein|nr:tail fiber protein [Verrucomicrobiae bacterium]